MEGARSVMAAFGGAFNPAPAHVGAHHGRQPAPFQLPPGRVAHPGLQLPAGMLDHPTPAIQATVNPYNRALVRRLERFVNDPLPCESTSKQGEHQCGFQSVWRAFGQVVCSQVRVPDVSSSVETD